MKSKPRTGHSRGTVEAQSSHSRHRRLTRTWPKNKRRNLLPIDPLIGPVNKNAVAEAARDREWLAPAPIVAGLAWLDWRPVPWPLNLCCRPRALFAYSSSLSLTEVSNLVSCCFNTQINCPQILCPLPLPLTCLCLCWGDHCAIQQFSLWILLISPSNVLRMRTPSEYCLPLSPAPVQPHCLSARPFRLRAWSEIGFMRSLQNAPNCTHFLSTSPSPSLTLSFPCLYCSVVTPSAGIIMAQWTP